MTGRNLQKNNNKTKQKTNRAGHSYQLVISQAIMKLFCLLNYSHVTHREWSVTHCCSEHFQDFCLNLFSGVAIFPGTCGRCLSLYMLNPLRQICFTYLNWHKSKNVIYFGVKGSQWVKESRIILKVICWKTEGTQRGEDSKKAGGLITGRITTGVGTGKRERLNVEKLWGSLNWGSWEAKTGTQRLDKQELGWTWPKTKVTRNTGA